MYPSASVAQEWRMVAAGANKRHCVKRLAKLAEDLKKPQDVVDADQGVNIEAGSVEFDGYVLNRSSTTNTKEGKWFLMTFMKSLCFPDTVDPRSGA